MQRKMVNPIVYLVDDDASIRKSLERLLCSADYRVEVFASAEDFLQFKKYKRPGCVVLDIRMPGLSGIDLQEEIFKRQIFLPIIFITGHGDIPTSVHAMKKGAVDFLTKPFNDKELLNAIDKALKKDVENVKNTKIVASIQRRIKTLTPREFEILRWIITGMLNKQVAYVLHITEKTVKVHRGCVMRKMGVKSIAELVRLTQKAGIPPAKKS